jgi:hypothetical protein
MISRGAQELAGIRRRDFEGKATAATEQRTGATSSIAGIRVNASSRVHALHSWPASLNIGARPSRLRYAFAPVAAGSL